MTNWFWAYLTFSGGIRLITGEAPNPDTATEKDAPPASADGAR
jgi:hypothetical protein